MAKSHTLAALSVAFLLAGCAGPTPTPQPSATPAIPPTASPTVLRTGTASPTSTPAAGPSASPIASLPTDEPTIDAAVEWTERADVAAGPSAREDHTWTVSDDGTVAYLFGGRGAAGSVLGDLWQFELITDTWSELHPSGDSPAARFGHTATWVPGSGVVVWSGQGARFFDDIWLYDPVRNTWQELPSLGAVPQARYGSCASLGPDGDLWISHGFTADDGRFADTRSYNFTSGTWTDRTPTTGDRPVERCLHDCYWSARGALVLYGGQTTGVTALGDLWMLDPAEGLWTAAPQSTAPPRNLYAFAANESGGRVLGGGSLAGGFLDDAWLINDEIGRLLETRFDGANPPARSSATLIYSPPRNRYLLFGGMNDEGVLDDLWELSGNT